MNLNLINSLRTFEKVGPQLEPGIGKREGGLCPNIILGAKSHQPGGKREGLRCQEPPGSGEEGGRAFAQASPCVLRATSQGQEGRPWVLRTTGEWGEVPPQVLRPTRKSEGLVHFLRHSQ